MKTPRRSLRTNHRAPLASFIPVAGFDFDSKNPLSDQVVGNWRKLKADWDAVPANRNSPFPAPPAELKGGLLFAGKNGQPRRSYDFDWSAGRSAAASKSAQPSILYNTSNRYHPGQHVARP